MQSSLVRAFLSAVTLSLAIFVATPSSQAADFIIEPIDYDIPAEVATAAEENKNLVVMFSTNGCPYCAKMRKRVFPHPKVSAQYDETFYMFEINMAGDLEVVTHEGESSTEKEYAQQMRVRATPVFVFFGKDGKEALRLTGYQDPAMFMTAGRYVSSDAYKDGTSFIKFVRSGK